MRRITDWATVTLQWLAVLSLTAMILHLCTEVALRSVFGRSLDGTLEIVAEIYMPFVVFAALAATHVRGEEIRVDLIAQFISRQALRWLDMAGRLLLSLAAAAMAWMTGKHTLHALSIGDRIEAGAMVIPAWPGKAIVTAGFALLALAALSHLLEERRDGAA